MRSIAIRYAARVAVTVALAQAVAGALQAQAIPYQSSSRGLVGSGFGQTALPQGGVFEPRVEAAVQYASNTGLASGSESRNESLGLELAPGLYASYSVGSIIAAIDYSLIGRAWDDSDANNVTHRLEANGQWYAVPEWLSLQGQASYGDTIIDPRNGLNYGGRGIFGSSNLAEVATASGGPVLRHVFRLFQVSAQYSYGRTWYLDEGKGDPSTEFDLGRDVIDQNAGVSIGTSPSDARFSGQLFYNWRESEFENQFPYRYERAGFDGAYQVLRTLWLVGDVGRESDLLVSTMEGGLDADFWDVGLRWMPSRNTSAEARYGERFFGESYSFSMNHQARLLRFTASYSEQPTVETQRVSLRDFFPGELPPGIPDIDLGLYNKPYVAKSARAGVSLAGARTTVSISGHQYEREFLEETLAGETSRGLTLGATRQFASNLSGRFTLSYSDIERADDFQDPANSGVSHDYDTQALLSLSRSSGPKLTISGETGYFQRSGRSDYDGWWIGLRARYEPRATGR